MSIITLAEWLRLEGYTMVRMIVFVVIALTTFSCSATSEQGLEVLKNGLKFSSFYLIGDAEVGSANDFPRHIVSATEYAEMKCLEKAGYLSFTRDEAIADGNFHGFSNMLRTVHDGITRHIATTMTPLGKETTESFVEDKMSRQYESTRPGLYLLKLRKNEASIDKIISNREVSKDTGRYRIIEVLVTDRPTEDGKRISEACDQTDEETHHKIRELVKWDNFDSAWKEVAADTALDQHTFKGVYPPCIRRTDGVYDGA